MLKWLIAGGLLLLASASAAPDTEATIIAMERAALDRSDAGDVRGFLDITAEDVVYMDPALDRPLIGLKALTDYYAKFPPYEPAHGIMSNPKVQVLGRVAVLSFHYVSAAGTPRQKVWNATEVYRKTGKVWRIVNTHWSLTDPMPQPFN